MATQGTPSKALMAKLKKSQKTLSKVRKNKAPAGFMKDEELIKIFDLKAGKGTTTKCQLRSAAMKEHDGQLIVEIRYIVVEGPAKSTPLSEAFWFNFDDEDSLAKSFEQLCFTLQKMGFETDELTTEDIPALVEELTSDKPFLILYVSCYKAKAGKKKGQLCVGVRVNGTYDPDDDGESDDEDDPEESTEDDEEEDSEDSEEEDDEDAESDSDDAEDEDEGDDDESESDDEPEEEEEDEDGFDEDDPGTWVGYEAFVKPPKAKAKFKAEIISYSKRTKKLKVKSDKGASYDILAEHVIDWVE